MSSQYTIVDYSAEEFSSLESCWRQLERGADMTAFQSFDWHRNLLALYDSEKTKNLFRKWRYIVVNKNERPILIAPLQIQQIGLGYKAYGAPKGVYFIGRQGYTDYLNVIYDVFEPEAMQNVIEYVAEKYKQKHFFFERIPEKTESYQYLVSHYDVKKYPVHCAALFVPETFDMYKAALSKHTRQNIRTALNRLKKSEYEFAYQFVCDEDDSVKEQIIELNQKRLKKKSSASKKEQSFAGRIYCFFSEIIRKLFSSKLDVVRKSKNTFCFIVKDGEKLVSFFWGIYASCQKEYYVILAGVDEEYEWFSPNISQLYAFFEEYYQNQRNDIRVLDFTRGAEGYKKTIGCVERLTCGLMFDKHDN